MKLPSIETSVSEAEAEQLRRLAFGKTVLEVGSWRGFSTVLMAQVAAEVHAVDWHRGDEHAGHDESLMSLWRNIHRYDVQNTVRVYVGDSAMILPMLPRGYFDLAFIDAFHETEAVARDANLVLPLVHVYGLVAFHDYGRFGVKEAVDAIGGVKWHSLTETLAVVEKR